ncbi:MAG: antiterminator LoaP [Chitinispirillia bacterium]|nr:antiterminator LoaP [Chitinispirillia bacterium]
MNNWVILFVQTGAEEILLRMLKERLNANEYLPFLPTRETPRRSKGVISKVRNILFPGYIFIQTNIEADLIAKKLRHKLIYANNNRIDGIYSILCYGNDKNYVAIREPERLYWESLFDSDFCVTGSTGIIAGDTVSIISGPLVGKEGCIKKINRHKREAVIELDIMGAVREIRLMLEIIEKRQRGICN